MHSYHIIEKGCLRDKAMNALILVHGRGATANDILPLSDFFTDKTWYVVAPQAANNAWYPHSFMAPVEQNEPWLSSAIDILHKLLQNVQKNIPPENIYLMGFSQGACLTAEVAARFACRYGGVVSFTGGLIGNELNPANYKGNFDGTFIYLSNSTNDPYIPLGRSFETQQQLRKMAANVELDIIPDRPHIIIKQELEKAKTLIFKR
jgi:phospholipase/carboxylesterase